MEKRLPLALFLSFLVLFGWSITHPPEEVPEEARTELQPTEASPTGGSGPTGPSAEPAPSRPELPAIGEVVAESEERRETVFFGEPGGPGYYRAIFSNRGGRLVELRTGRYFKRLGVEGEAREDPLNWTVLLEPVETGAELTGSLLLSTSASSRDLVREPLDSALWRMELLGEQGREGVVFTYAPGTGVRFTKRIRPEPGSYRFAVEIEIENTGLGRSGPAQFVFTPAGCMPEELGDRFYIEPRSIAAGPAGADDPKMKSESRKAKARDLEGSLDVGVPLAFAGVHNKYFAFLLRGADPEGTASMQGARYRRVADRAWALENPEQAAENLRYMSTDVILELGIPQQGAVRSWNYRLYAGPKDRVGFRDDYGPNELVLKDDLRTFSSIGNLLLKILGVLQRFTGNWGWAIILLTLMVRGLLFPLNRRSQTAMARYQKKMKRVQPQIDEIKEKYKDEPQKLRQEQARVMQSEGAFPPLGGCLPVFVQIPIFFGLFSALRTSFDLRQAPFMWWIDDLAQPDRLLELGLQIPIIFTTLDFTYLNLLPIVMTVLWIVQQKTMPKPTDEQAARMQKMMTFMPIFMGFILYNYAAGLSLYMITTSGFGIIEQRVIKKIWPVDDTEVEKKKKRGCGPFSGIMENMAKKHQEQMKKLQAQQNAKAGGSGKKRKKRK